MTPGLALANTIIQVLLIVAAGWRALAGEEEAAEASLPGDAGRGRGPDRPDRGAHGSFVGRLRPYWNGWSWFTAEIVIHHTLGVIVVLLFIYFNLVMTGVVKVRAAPAALHVDRLRALVGGLWRMGIHLYWYIWR